MFYRIYFTKQICLKTYIKEICTDKETKQEMEA